MKFLWKIMIYKQLKMKYIHYFFRLVFLYNKNHLLKFVKIRVIPI